MENQKEKPGGSENGESKKKKPVPEYLYGRYSNYQRQQTNRYNKENYKTITVRFRDNGDREMIQAAAKMLGVSLNGFCEALLVEEAYKIVMEMRKNNPEAEEDGEKQGEKEKENIDNGR